MSTGCVLAIAAQIHTHSKATRVATTRLVLSNNLWAILIKYVPDNDFSVPGRGSQVLTILIESDSPYGCVLHRALGNLGVWGPLARVGVETPYFNLATKPGARSYFAVAGCAEVMAA